MIRCCSVLSAAVVLLVGGAISAQAPAIPPHKAAIVLFDGTNLDHFDTFLKTKGLNSDPEHVFQVEDGVLHVSGKEMGYVITKQAYHDYYLRAEFKWGEGTFGDRAGKARDSGILYDIQGEQKVWPRSIEFQITEGGTGDFWMTDGAENVVGFRDKVGDLEKPHGEWNVLELVTHGNDVKQYVNGKLANEGTDPSPAEGKILFQSEGAEVFFRDIKLYPLK
jgi:beta-glucanase (GH16 family)